MSILFTKTAKGQEEIKTRAAGLSLRMRQVLIFIDGKRSLDDLHGMLKGDDLDEILRFLVEQGFADVSGTPDKVKPPAPKAIPTASPAPPQPAEAEKPVAPKVLTQEEEKKRLEEEEQAELALARSFMGKMS